MPEITKSKQVSIPYSAPQTETIHPSCAFVYLDRCLDCRGCNIFSCSFANHSIHTPALFGLKLGKVCRRSCRIRHGLLSLGITINRRIQRIPPQIFRNRRRFSHSNNLEAKTQEPFGQIVGSDIAKGTRENLGIGGNGSTLMGETKGNRRGDGCFLK
jgi:hypothetical protein